MFPFQALLSLTKVVIRADKENEQIREFVANLPCSFGPELESDLATSTGKPWPLTYDRLNPIFAFKFNLLEHNNFNCNPDNIQQVINILSRPAEPQVVSHQRSLLDEGFERLGEETEILEHDENNPVTDPSFDSGSSRTTEVATSSTSTSTDSYTAHRRGRFPFSPMGIRPSSPRPQFFRSRTRPIRMQGPGRQWQNQYYPRTNTPSTIRGRPPVRWRKRRFPGFSNGSTETEGTDDKGTKTRYY